MSLYVPINSGGPVAIAVCARCGKKMPYADLVKDPNNGLWVCKADQDLFDPWRLPARKAEDISLQHPRQDVELEP